MTAAVALPPPDPESLPFVVRAATADDLPFIHDSWLLSARDGEAHNEGRHFVWWQKQDQREILSRRSTRVRIVCPADDPETILGWAAIGETSPPCVYFVYVRAPSRALGIARMLVGDLVDRECFYGARPPRIWNAGKWVPAPVAAKIPKRWRFVPRIGHREV